MLGQAYLAKHGLIYLHHHPDASNLLARSFGQLLDYEVSKEPIILAKKDRDI